MDMMHMTWWHNMVKKLPGYGKHVHGPVWHCDWFLTLGYRYVYAQDMDKLWNHVYHISRHRTGKNLEVDKDNHWRFRVSR